MPCLASGDQSNNQQPISLHVGSHGVHRADGHAPIGVMGDHMHGKGEWMLSYRFMRMEMKNSRDGNSGINPEEIVTTVANPFFGQPMQPPTLRVVPTQMTMDMHMFGAMYAPTDWLTLMLMGSYIRKDMDHITFMGPAGTTRRSEFTTRSSGFGDTKIGGLIRLYDDDTAVVIGCGYGGFVALSTIVLAERFGVVGLGSVLGLFYTSQGLGGLIGPPVAGWLIDRTDGYLLPIAVCGGLLILARILLVGLPVLADGALAPEG